MFRNVSLSPLYPLAHPPPAFGACFRCNGNGSSREADKMRNRCRKEMEGEEERAGGARGGFLCSSLQRSKAIKLSCCSVFGVLGDYDLDYYRNFHVHVKT